MTNTISLELQNTVRGFYVPEENLIQTWLNQGFPAIKNKSLVLRVVDEAEGAELNRSWRNRNYATNILSFPYIADHPHEETDHLGDLVITAEVVKNEADKYNQSEEFRWAHMLIHGVLHLLGYDHQNNKDADVMEALEAKIMIKIGYSDPYAIK